MIKIGILTIIDTGYLTITASTGTQATMANSGNAIGLKSAEMTFGGPANVDDSPVINAASTGASTANLNFGSITPATMTILGVMNRTNISDMDLLKEMDNLRKTVGIKLIYYSSFIDGYRELTNSIGSTDSTHLSGNIPHLHVRVTNFTARQVGTSKIVRYSIEMRETG